MNKIVKLALILFLISAVVAGILGGVYVLTKPNIDKNTQAKTEAAYSSVLKSESGYEDIAYNGDDTTITKIAKSGDGNGYVVELTVSGAQGMISLAVGVDNDGACTGYSIISHSETPGLGALAQSDVAFMDQFKGADASVAVTKDGGSIDALSGATITSRAVCKAVASAIAAVETVK